MQIMSIVMKKIAQGASYLRVLCLQCPVSAIKLFLNVTSVKTRERVREEETKEK